MNITFKEYKQKSGSFGSSLAGRDDWCIGLSRHRDSDLLSESNFHAALRSLGGESDTLEIVRFGHWAAGWVEHIFLHPSRKAEGEALEQALEQYPILDEDDFGRRESEAAYEGWISWGCQDFCEVLQEEFDLVDSTVRFLRSRPDYTLHHFEDTAPHVLATEGENVHVRTYGGQTRLTRTDMATIIKAIRKDRMKGK